PLPGLSPPALLPPGPPWRSLAAVALAPARWVAWFPPRRLSPSCGAVPPVALAAASSAPRPRPAAGCGLRSARLRPP
ncbi:hypothetical protein C3R38_21280, partial [Mycobacterium tuberculosis]